MDRHDTGNDGIDNRYTKKAFIAEGTTCESCAEIIRRQAMKVEGVKKVTFSYADERGTVTFDPAVTDIDTILYRIEEKGYTCFTTDLPSAPVSADSRPRKPFRSDNSSRTVGWLFGLIGMVIVGYFLLKFTDTVQLPEISQNMGYGLLFIVGLLTGFHCIAMCGGFVVGYTADDAKAGRKSHKSHLLYGVGKTVSYTIIGAAFGLLGSIIAFTPFMRGMAGLIAGIFLVLFGIKMLNIFPALRRFSLHTPRFISRAVGRNQSSSPLVIGLLNGLMIACGPLQAIYIMAAGTGSVVEGAKLLFVFGLGTLPVMLGFGYFAGFISSKATNKILKASGVIVIILGIIMFNRGLALTGSGYDIDSVTGQFTDVSDRAGLKTGSASENVPLLNADGYQEIRMTVDSSGFTPNRFVLKKGVPVKWIIDGKELNGCNNAIQVPKYGLEFKVKQGEQTIEFTPTETGTVAWSCWMGMIPGSFIVKDDIGSEADVQQALASAPAPVASGTCGMGGSGGCGCGG